MTATFNNPFTDAMQALRAADRAPIRDADRLDRLLELCDFMKLQVEIYPLDDRRRVLLAKVEAAITRLEDSQ